MAKSEHHVYCSQKEKWLPISLKGLLLIDIFTVKILFGTKIKVTFKCPVCGGETRHESELKSKKPKTKKGSPYVKNSK